jgi:hypothetical protein
MQTKPRFSVHWIQESGEPERLNTVLNCFEHRGLATVDQVETLTKLTNHPVRDAIRELANPPGGLPALLQPISVVLPGQRGRPQSAYVLTESGSQALGPRSHRAPALTENVEAAHALMEMKVFVAAQKEGMEAEIEKVVYFDYPKNIRVDVLVGHKRIVEIEQRARVNDIARITDKLLRLSSFFKSRKAKTVDLKIMVLFGLAADDKSTISIWQNVLAEVELKTGNLPFELYWQDINYFLVEPEWNNLDHFRRLEPAKPKQDRNPKEQETQQQEATFKLSSIKYPKEVNVMELNIIMDAIEDSMEKGEELWSRNRRSFFEMMETIYDCSHYDDGPVKTESAFPFRSLYMLDRFLHLYQNKQLLEQLQDGFRQVRTAQNRGVVFFRSVLTQFYWDVFLRYFAFGRNGPLEVGVYVPSLDDDCSEIRTRVRIKSWQLINGRGLQETQDIELAQTATAWVFDALYHYANDLGLIVDRRTKGGRR